MFRCASDNPEILSLQVYSTLETSQCVSISFSLIKFQNITRRFRIHNKTKKKKEHSVDKLTFFSKHINIWIIVVHFMDYGAPLVCAFFKGLERRRLLYPANVCSLSCNKTPTLLAPRTIQWCSHDNIHMTVRTLIITVMQPSDAVLLHISYTFIRVLKWRSTIRSRRRRRLWDKSLSFI